MTTIETGDVLEIKIYERDRSSRVIYHLISECLEATPDRVNFNDLQVIKQVDGPAENPWSVSFGDFENQDLFDFYDVAKLGTKETLPEYYL